MCIIKRRARVLIVDDHEIFRKGLCTVLALHPEFEICGEAVDGMDAIEKAKDLVPDVIVMDLSMPRLDGFQASRAIRAFQPNAKILILSQHDSSQMLSAAQNAGAGAYVTKTQVSRFLIGALQSLIRGEPFDWNSGQIAPGSNSV